jgi:alpha-D-xyloside xylohydrolase
MKSAKILISAILLACTTALSAADFVRDGNNVVININQSENGAKLLRLQVVNDNIIRVEATAEKQFPVKSSLIIIPQTSKPQYTVNDHGAIVEVNAKNVKACVDKQTGRITFYDKSGKVLLKEANNGKSFTRYTVPEENIGIGTLTDAQKNGWSWRALFESPADEAFYGLGQHQSEEFNYKGKNEELFQYNTKVSVPFIMSNKNYGLLWDSYSLCRWGNPNEYQQLGKAFRIYDKEGNAGKLTGTYTAADGKQIVRGEDSLYFENSREIVNLPKNFKLNGSNVVYEGYLEAPESNDFRFILYYAGYVKVYIGGKEVVAERWRTAWNPNAYKFTCHLNKGEKTQVRIEWQPDGDVSYCGLRAAKSITDAEQNMVSIWSEMSRDMDYYFIAGDNMDQVVSGYRTLTGKSPVYPKWALGFWQSRERYKTSADIEETMSEFRKRHIPVDNIVQDWNYWKDDQWGSHQFDPQRYPNPQAMLDSVHAMHGRFMISVWPKFYCNTDNYKELDKHGWMYHQAVKDSIYDWLGYMGSFYDAYSAGARKMFWRQMDENLYSKYKAGVDAWWMDASEPNVRDCTPIGYRKALSGPTALGSSTEYFNAYSIVNADAIYNGQRSVQPNKRVFLLTRSGFAGEQRFSTATWSGDIGTRWEDMRAQMTAGINYSMCGLPFWGMDQGGFCVENRYVAAQQLFDKSGIETDDLKEWRELQTRWNQFGCFIPLYRTHGQWPLREVWNIAPDNHPAYKSIVYYDKLRYNLMPYLYSMAGWVNLKDYTMLRGLVMDFSSDAKVNNIGNQWMFGPALMACPVEYYKARNREVYFPEQCGWYDLYTGRHINGGQNLIVDAPYERIPVFVREGSIIPFGPSMEWSDEKKPELINLYVYEGGNADFMLYEDEGTNYNYEKGKYATIDIKYNENAKTLTIGQRKGSFDGMLKDRRFNIVVVSKSKQQPLNVENPQGKLVKYSGKSVTIKL